MLPDTAVRAGEEACTVQTTRGTSRRCGTSFASLLYIPGSRSIPLSHALLACNNYPFSRGYFPAFTSCVRVVWEASLQVSALPSSPRVSHLNPCCHLTPRRRPWFRSSSSMALRSQPERAAAPAEGTAVSEPAELPAAPVEPLPEFISNDAVSYWVHPGKESNIWLVGTIHRTAPSVEVSP